MTCKLNEIIIQDSFLPVKEGTIWQKSWLFTFGFTTIQTTKFFWSPGMGELNKDHHSGLSAPVMFRYGIDFERSNWQKSQHENKEIALLDTILRNPCTEIVCNQYAGE